MIAIFLADGFEEIEAVNRELDEIVGLETIKEYIRSLQNTTENSIESLYNLVDNSVEAIEFKVKEDVPELTDVPLRELSLKKNILICAIIRKRKIIIPNGDDHIELGDSVVIVTKEHHFSNLTDILD
mgnify:CR=1 FL=1